VIETVIMARQDRPFVILDAGERTGDSWRNRWDSLRLFTPGPLQRAGRDALPRAGHSFPTKDQVADYLEAYAGRFDLPVGPASGWTGSRGTGTDSS
jgi:putative flavoprotein involved in K+ transport